MDTLQDFTTEIFFEGQESKLWPRRLLHVPSMTSVEREGEDMYMGVEKPQYNIISYTWGRFEVSEGPSLQVKTLLGRSRLSTRHVSLSRILRQLCVR